MEIDVADFFLVFPVFSSSSSFDPPIFFSFCDTGVASRVGVAPNNNNNTYDDTSSVA